MYSLLFVYLSQGSEITPPHQLNHTFKFKDYSPHAFAYLRRMFGVNEYEFLLSVCGNANYIEFQVSFEHTFIYVLSFIRYNISGCY